MNKPEHQTFLDELCDPRPSSRLMLREAWSALSEETKIKVLFRVTSDAQYAENLDLLEATFSSPNAYLRYLGARSGWLDENGPNEDPRKVALRRRLRLDPSSLVQGGLVYQHAYSQLIGLGPDPERVCTLPPDERLVLLSWVRHPADWFPKVLRKAVHVSLPPDELRAMTEEYLVSHVARKLGQPSEDGWSERECARCLDELWRMAALLADRYAEASTLLVTQLPTRLPGSEAEQIPQDALQVMRESTLITLLRRPDVDLPEFRGQILVQPQSPSEDLLQAAAARPVAMTPAQFAMLLNLPERIPALEYAEGLPLVMSKALKDCYRYKYGQTRFGELTDYPEHAFRSQLARLPVPEQMAAVKELRKYQLATMLAPWPTQPQPVDEYSLSGEFIDRGKPWSLFVARLQYPKALAVPGDPWATYCKFGDYFDTKDNYEALKRFSPGYYPDDDAGPPR